MNHLTTPSFSFISCETKDLGSMAFKVPSEFSKLYATPLFLKLGGFYDTFLSQINPSLTTLQIKS